MDYLDPAYALGITSLMIASRYPFNMVSQANARMGQISNGEPGFRANWMLPPRNSKAGLPDSAVNWRACHGQHGPNTSRQSGATAWIYAKA